MGKLSPRDARLFAKLDELYSRLPTMACRKQCGMACGPMTLTDAEARRLQVHTHVKPRTVEEHRCVYLTPQGTCRAYAVRPLICRAWGTMKMLSCPHGCVPSEWLDIHDYLLLAQAVERLGGGRVLRTHDDGLGHQPGEAYSTIPSAGPGLRSKAQRDEDAERTKGLRAIFGGRIIAAISDDV